ncbi:MAG TPA: phospholipase D-like domain-containing protein [Methylophilaceae bacterium]|nr:phospholipase D-like domain-containing protein [Methylophilaceae bacterium]
MPSSFRLSIGVMLLILLSTTSGCATLPDVTQMIDDAPQHQTADRIVSAKGLLSAKQSKTLVERLKKTAGDIDIIERNTAVIESISESPLTKGNKVTILMDGAATYAAMFEIIESATDHINIETFIIEDIEDQAGRKLSDILLRKQAEGVQVNILYDSKGSFSTPAAFFEKLSDGGIQLVEFSPVNPLKARGKWRLVNSDHRKVMIADGKVAIMGGVNISKVYSMSLSSGRSGEGGDIPWRDTDVQIEGPAVEELQKLFVESWEGQQGPQLGTLNFYPGSQSKGNALVRILGSSPGELNRLTYIMYVAALTFAEKSLYMTNAYFIPDEQTLKALTDAALQGVDVKIILAETTDSALAKYAERYTYDNLLKAGVKLYKRRDVLLHAKTMVVDGVWSTIGSTNMDFWSFSNNDEVNAVVLSPTFAAEMEAMFENDLAQSDEIHWEEWKSRSMLDRAKEWGAKLFTRWL